VCTKCGIVDTSGEKAHGFVLDKSCSNVGSTKLVKGIKSDVKGVTLVGLLRELECGTRTPGKFQWMIKSITEKQIVGRYRAEKTACTHGLTGPVTAVENDIP
jgi:hypothetical protein